MVNTAPKIIHQFLRCHNVVKRTKSTDPSYIPLTSAADAIAFKRFPTRFATGCAPLYASVSSGINTSLVHAENNQPVVRKPQNFGSESRRTFAT